MNKLDKGIWDRGRPSGLVGFWYYIREDIDHEAVLFLENRALWLQQYGGAALTSWCFRFLQHISHYKKQEFSPDNLNSSIWKASIIIKWLGWFCRGVHFIKETKQALFCLIKWWRMIVLGGLLCTQATNSHVSKNPRNAFDIRQTSLVD